MPFDGLHNTNLLDDLRTTREFIQRGWCQDSCFAPHSGGGCLFAAIRDVTHGRNGNDPRFRRLHDWVQAHIPDSHAISTWNDTPGRTQADVLALIDQCIEDVS
jgi:hypothetical protein